MTSKNSPVPFRHDDEFRAIRIFDAENRHIATLHANFGDWVDGVKIGLSHNDVRDNARLIAAAPELLEALQEFIGAVDSGTTFADASVVACARAAIAKATGTAQAQG